MDFDTSEEQQAVLDAVGVLLDRHAGPKRAIQLARELANEDANEDSNEGAHEDTYDHALDRALAEGGFNDIARSMSSLEAALVTEAVAKAGGRCAFATAALVAANLGDDPNDPHDSHGPIEGPIAIALRSEDGPVRFAAHAKHLLVISNAGNANSAGNNGNAHLIALEPGVIEPVSSNFGYPMGLVPNAMRRGGRALTQENARIIDWWRLALAAEATGTMQSALDVTVEYLSRRRQFGRTIGSFQAVQHRLAECFVQIEAARWLTYECAAQGAPREGAATVAAHALAAAARVFTETHQLSGAIGFTHEHDLHVWSMRLHALRTELGGVAGHRRAIAHSRWMGPQR